MAACRARMSGNVPRHIAIDLGASGGRVAVGSVDQGVLSFDLLHRFPNRAVPLGAGLYWNVLELWREIRHGLRLAAAQGPVASVGVTTWGVDYALFDADLLAIDMVHSHRDRRTDGVIEALDAIMPRAELYQATGVQFLPINTLPQLVAAQRASPGLFSRATRFLMLPDLIHYWLCGVMVCEHTNASTTQLYDPVRRDWSDAVLAAFGIPRAMFPTLVEPGTILGPLLAAVAADTGLAGTVVIAPATHDTASAIAAIPAEAGDDWAYISSGTWCLAGIERPGPLISEATRRANITNEQGIAGTTRLLKNTSGLFILQECLRAWGDPPIEPVLQAAAALTSDSAIDPTDREFVDPGITMPDRITRWCAGHGITLDPTPAALTRAVLHGLAASMAASLAEIDRVADHHTKRIHIVGGGSRIDLLCQMVADRTGGTVIAGPVEATSAGNLLIQAAGLGVIAREAIRPVMRATAACRRFDPVGGSYQGR
jgi:rhamnulokinase